MSPKSRTLVGMSNNGPFGIDPEEFDRVLRETGEGIRGVFDRLGREVTLTEAGRALVAPEGPLSMRRTLQTYCQL